MIFALNRVLCSLTSQISPQFNQFFAAICCNTGLVVTNNDSFFSSKFAAFAHRGGWLDPADAGRENTLYAFAKAVAFGYEYLETDVHTTSDGVLIAFHDAVTDRVAGKSGQIDQMSFAELRELRIAGKDQIPTLDEVLAAFPSAKINIDIKAPGAIEPLVDTLAAHNAWKRVCVASFSPERLHAFRRLAGRQVATAVSGLAVPWNSWIPLLPQLVNSVGQAIQVPISQKVGPVELPVVTKRLIDNAHASGKYVHVWTINDAEQMRELIELGVDGLVSDDIGLLQEVLAEYDLWE